MIKGIIFDMDGVLIDAKEWHYEALNKALMDVGFEIINKEDHINIFDGLPTKEKLAILSKQKGLPLELHDHINRLKQHYTMELVHAKCKPNTINEHALANLKAMGYKLAVASNAIADSVKTMLRKAHLDQYLEVIFSNSDVSKPKPDPEIYIKAIKALGFINRECLILEDNPNGIKAAIDSGAHVMVVKSTADVTLDNILAYISQIKSSCRTQN